MKKLVLLSAIFCAISASSFAQSFSFGPKIGANFANVVNLPGASNRIGITAGAFASLDMCDWFGLQTELMYAMQGFEVKGTETLKVAIDYVKMPVVTKYYLVSGLNLQLGASFNYMVNAQYKVNDHTTSFQREINRFDVEFLTGLGYEFDFGMVIEGRYSLGLCNIQGAGFDLEGVRNGALSMTVGWRF